MKIITQLVILTLSLLLVNVYDGQYCDNLLKHYHTLSRGGELGGIEEAIAPPLYRVEG